MSLVDNRIQLAANVLNITEEEAKKNSKLIDGIDALYFWNSNRGGKAVIINKDGERLVATSGVSFDKHVKAFLEGVRN